MNELPDTVWAKVDASGDCWTWTAYINGDGYGVVAVNGTNKMAHRAIYVGLVGPIPDGLEIDHLCKTKACVNPDHLEPVTHAENSRRRRKHCRRWHTDTYTDHRGIETCVRCRKDDRERYQARLREKA